MAGGIPSPHGNKLIDRFVVSDKKNMQDMYTLQVSNELRNDIENIADGIFTPLEGFVGEDDFQSIVKRGRLSNGLAWTVPIILDADEQEARNIKDAGEIALQQKKIVMKNLPYCVLRKFIHLTRLHAQNRSTKLMISNIQASKKWST